MTTTSLLTSELALLSKTILKWAGDASWIQCVHAPCLNENHTIYFELHPPLHYCSTLESQYELAVVPSLRLSVFFPESPDDKPFCFVEDEAEHPVFAEASATVAQAANQLLQPLAKSSLALLVSLLQRAARDHGRRLWPPLAETGANPTHFQPLAPPAHSSWARSRTAALVAERIRCDLFACEAKLAFFSIALSSCRRETVCDPILFTCLPVPSSPTTAAAPKHSASPPPPSPPSCSSFGQKRVVPPDEVAAHLLTVLDSLPPLSHLKSPEAVARLPMPCLAILAATLVVSSVHFRTLQAPGQASRGDTDSGSGEATGAHGSNALASSSSLGGCGSALRAREVPWAEVEVSKRTPNWSFEGLARVHGRREGFHGSGAANWWSIAHRGLRNHSHTKHQRNGAVFGEGVYLATDQAVSRSFAAGGGGGERPRVHRTSALALVTGNDGSTGSMTPADEVGDSTSQFGIGSWVNKERPEFPFECVGRCSVIDLAANIAPRPGVTTGGWQPSPPSSDRRSRSSGRTNGDRDFPQGDGDYLVVSDESQVHLGSIMFFRSHRIASSSRGTNRKPPGSPSTTSTAHCASGAEGALRERRVERRGVVQKSALRSELRMPDALEKNRTDDRRAGKVSFLARRARQVAPLVLVLAVVLVLSTGWLRSAIPDGSQRAAAGLVAVLVCFILYRL